VCFDVRRIKRSTLSPGIFNGDVPLDISLQRFPTFSTRRGLARCAKLWKNVDAATSAETSLSLSEKIFIARKRERERERERERGEGGREGGRESIIYLPFSASSAKGRKEWKGQFNVRNTSIAGIRVCKPATWPRRARTLIGSVTKKEERAFVRHMKREKSSARAQLARKLD